MKNHVPRSKEDAPINNVIAVQSLTPTFALMALKDIDGLRPGETRPVYGGYVSVQDHTLSVYSNGTVPKDWRDAVEENGFENEILTEPLPDTIEEINMAIYADAYTLIITNGEVMQKPKPKGKQIAFVPAKEPYILPMVSACKVIEHDATTVLRMTEKGQFEFPFAEPVIKPSNLKQAQ